MTNELNKRIKTSILMSLLLISSIFINKAIFIIILVATTAVSIKELWSLINKIIIKHKQKKILELFINILILFYFTIFFLSALKIFEEKGPSFFLYILLICISSDLGGFVVGKNVGGIKLTTISPNKTVSGCFGSFFFSLIPLISIAYFNEIYPLILSDFLLVLLISLISQLGDLIISYIKRKAKVKDSGTILPGHGGLLDRLDGVIFVIPFVYLLIFDKLVY